MLLRSTAGTTARKLLPPRLVLHAKLRQTDTNNHPQTAVQFSDANPNDFQNNLASFIYDPTLCIITPSHRKGEK